MSAYVYILKCSDDSYYTGSTCDLDRRFYEHQEGLGQGAYTKSRRPVKLVFAEEFENIIDAATAEKQIKGWRRAKKEALIRGDFDLLIALATRYKLNR